MHLPFSGINNTAKYEQIVYKTKSTAPFLHAHSLKCHVCEEKKIYIYISTVYSYLYIGQTHRHCHNLTSLLSKFAGSTGYFYSNIFKIIVINSEAQHECQDEITERHIIQCKHRLHQIDELVYPELYTNYESGIVKKNTFSLHCTVSLL